MIDFNKTLGGRVAAVSFSLTTLFSTGCATVGSAAREVYSLPGRTAAAVFRGAASPAGSTRRPAETTADGTPIVQQNTTLRAREVTRTPTDTETGTPSDPASPKTPAKPEEQTAAGRAWEATTGTVEKVGTGAARAVEGAAQGLFRTLGF